MNSAVKVLAIAPIIGSTGDTVNERQLITAISRYSKKVVVLSPVSIRYIIDRSYRIYLSRRPSNMKIITIPFTLMPFNQIWIINFVIYILYALLLFIVAYVLDLKINFDIVYVRDSRFTLFITFSKRLSTKTFVKIGGIAEEMIDTNVFRRLMESIMCAIDRHVMKNVAGIATASTNIAKRLFLKRQFLPRKIFIIPPGITWSIIDVVNRYCPRRKRILKDGIAVGFLGMLAHWQGIDILCDIVAELNRRGYKAKLKVIGDGPLRRYLTKKCIDTGVDVEITGFLMHHEALCLARKEFDVLVLPRIRTETTSNIIPIKVIEALALGIPLVVTNLPIYRILEGRGLYTAQRTPKHFADTILKTILNPHNKADHDLLKTFSYEYIASEFLKVALGSKT